MSHDTHTCNCPIRFAGSHCEGIILIDSSWFESEQLELFFISISFHLYCFSLVDHCSHCDPNAYCDGGDCHCSDGYEGTGYECHEIHEFQHHHHHIEGLFARGLIFGIFIFAELHKLQNI